MINVAGIVLENTSPTFDKIYSYIVPQNLESTALAGARVRVPFGRGNRMRTGLIVHLDKTQDTKGLKEIGKVLDTPPILNDEGLAILKYLKETTFCLWFDAFRLLIPAGLTITPKIYFRLGSADPIEHSEKSTEILDYLKKRNQPVPEETLYKVAEIKEDNKELSQLLASGHVIQSQQLRQRILDDKVTMVGIIDDDRQNLTPRQMEVLDFLLAEAPVSLREAMYYTGASRSVLDALERKGVTEYYEIIQYRGEFVDAEADSSPPPPLSPDQENVYKEILHHSKEKDPKPVLLYGVTGSGKTQVFLKLIQDSIANGKSAIVMVPEISLTSQTVRSLQGLFGNKVAVLHSGLSLGERMDEWKRIKEGKAPVVVGTRSAVFAPVENIGIIVIDEEQEHTYKSDRSPRFHARDIAYLRARYHKCQLLLSSATPAVESYHYAKENRYHLYTLPQRFGDAKLPEVFLVDMRDNDNLSSSLYLSQVLLDEIFYNLEHGEQSILLLNRRGYSTLVKCSACGAAAECPHCSVVMTYHTANDSLICHYCGYSLRRPKSCEQCGSEFIRYAGVGTQKLQEELQDIYPKARILRMDTDTTMARDSHEKMFDSFRKGEYDILIGTQMVAKGLNFPKVTLVGVVSADQSLYADDFRSYERSFSLLTQVVGRSGRGDFAGRAFIQTYTPDHPIIDMASRQDYVAFYNMEIVSRRIHLYPPYCTLTGVGFVGEKLAQVQNWASRFSHQLQKLAKEEYPHLPLRVLGPSPSSVLKVANKYRFKLIIKCRNDRETREFLRKMLDWFYANCKEVSVFIDMHYERM